MLPVCFIRVPFALGPGRLGRESLETTITPAII